MFLDKSYEDVKHSVKIEMLKKIKEYDKENYGHNDESKVFGSFFEEFIPKYRLPRNDIQNFWNNNFPNCFTMI